MSDAVVLKKKFKRRKMSFVTRFAPSPTGSLHLGGVRTLLYNYCIAKKSAGKMRLRIDDTDRLRYNKDSVRHIHDTVKWLGIQHDGDVVVQSQRTEIYQMYADMLIKHGFAYKCYCS